MQSVQPETTSPIALSHSSLGTLVIRFVGLLVAAVVVMTLIWSN